MRSKQQFQVWAFPILILLISPNSNEAFSPRNLNNYDIRTAQEPRSWKLCGVIRGEDAESTPFDVGQGGVRLAEQSAIKITGTVKHKPGKADPQPNELLRYNNIKQVDESLVEAVLQETGSKILCKGSGIELYANPGKGVENEVKLAPMEAVKFALTEAASAMDVDNLVLNFLGGDDLLMFEVLDAAGQMVLMLDVSTKTKISFNSLCHSSVPSGTCSIVGVSVGQQDGEVGEEKQFSAEKKAVASGEVYLHDGRWYTASELDINASVA